MVLAAAKIVNEIFTQFLKWYC